MARRAQAAAGSAAEAFAAMPVVVEQNVAVAVVAAAPLSIGDALPLLELELELEGGQLRLGTEETASLGRLLEQFAVLTGLQAAGLDVGGMVEKRRRVASRFSRRSG